MLLNCLYYRASDHFRRSLRRLLEQGRLGQVRSWFHTANAAVLPLLITQEEEPTHEEVDRLVRWALENCANNYAQFQRDWKSLKKAIRKEFATRGHVTLRDVPPHMRTYYHAYKWREQFPGPYERARYTLIWTQTRATGLCDHKMMVEAVSKFEETVTLPSERIVLNPTILLETTRGAVNIQGQNARVSVGPTSCFENTREGGGKTGFLQYLTTSRVLCHEYNPVTLEPIKVPARPVKNVTDLVSWAIGYALERPYWSRACRVHVVAEPSKARTITIAPMAYQVIMGVMAHLFQPTLTGRGVRSGLHADRHLWKFLREVLNPQDVGWSGLVDHQVWALSTDLAEATDFGNLSVARQIWYMLIDLSRFHPGFPTGMAVLAMNLYCGRRYFLLPDSSKNWRVIQRTRGWMMGDMMTKVILTVAHDYACRLTGLKCYTLVGDDEIALSSDRSQLLEQVRNLKKIGFRVSEPDTYVSRHLAFYCEEGCAVPQTVHDTVHVKMRRGEELPYLDYPRIRLLLPVPSEAQGYSQQNCGRFALLGKEARWVSNTNPPAKPYYDRASLLQHLLVPQDADTICPFTPIEIGGDGAYAPSASYMKEVVERKGRSPRETIWRLSQLLSNKFGRKWVRTDRLDKVVNRYHLYLPKVEGLRKLLPEESVIAADSDEKKQLLGSLKLKGLETPERTFFRLVRGFYYGALFSGRTPIEPTFTLDREFSAGHTQVPWVSFPRLYERWRNPGFQFRDQYDYYVLVEGLFKKDPLSLGWEFGPDSRPTAREYFTDWVKANVSLQDQAFPEVLKMLRTQQPLPNWVVDRLNLVIESDSYIMGTLPQECGSHVGLVSRDLRLAVRIRDFYYHAGGTAPEILVADPVLYMTGRMEEIPPPEPSHWIQDPGAMLHVDYTEFTDGFPHDEEIWDRHVVVTKTRHEGVSKVALDGYKPQRG